MILLEPARYLARKQEQTNAVASLAVRFFDPLMSTDAPPLHKDPL
jgi:hypothetical protein